MADNDNDRLTLTIHHQSTPHVFTLAADATLQDLTTEIASTTHIPIENQKLLIAPKPGMKKAPFAPTPLSELLPLNHPRFKLTLLGTPSEDIASLHAQSAATHARTEARAAALAKQRASAASPRRTTRGGSGIHTLSSTSNTNNYTFHRLLPLTYLPHPERSEKFLARLRDDPGIRTAMAKHKFSVPLLTEMDPALHTTSESRTLGLNRNKGEAIELRLRTDAYDGYRDYRTIRKTLCHELAHCVFSEHDRDFWDLTAQIEREVERADWKHGGQRVSEQDFYNPGDWEGVSEDWGEMVDERGWTGGSFVLGTSSSSSSSGAQSGGDGGAGSMREALAKAAEERMRRERERRG